MKKIGFVGGISWTSTLDYYQYFPKKKGIRRTNDWQWDVLPSFCQWRDGRNEI